MARMSLIPISFPPELWDMFYLKHGREARRRIRDLVSIDLQMYSPELEDHNETSQIEELKSQLQEKQEKLRKHADEARALALTLQDLEKRAAEENKLKEKERKEWLKKRRWERKNHRATFDKIKFGDEPVKTMEL